MCRNTTYALGEFLGSGDRTSGRFTDLLHELGEESLRFIEELPSARFGAHCVLEQL
jgi:hypothetical protein